MLNMLRSVVVATAKANKVFSRSTLINCRIFFEKKSSIGDGKMEDFFFRKIIDR